MANKNDAAPSLGRQLNFTTGRLNALCQKRLDPFELSLPQWIVLSCLWREAELSMGELADRIGTGVPATSRIVDRMEDRGLVTRRKDAEDKRSVRILTTPQGDTLKHLALFYEDINATLLNGFSDAERTMTFDLLARMERNAVAALQDDTA